MTLLRNCMGSIVGLTGATLLGVYVASVTMGPNHRVNAVIACAALGLILGGAVDLFRAELRK
jgi:uncharacterized membrane protein